MAKKPYVSVTGVDGLLLTIEGKFSAALDEVLLDKTGKFLTEMDKAGRKVFLAMTTSGTSYRNIRVSGVMGTNVKVPGFLAEFVPADQKWEPLTKEYLKRKKRMVARGQISTANMWSYSGSLIRYFKKNSSKLTEKTNNTNLKKFIFKNTHNLEAKERTLKDQKDVLFKYLPAKGAGLGDSSKLFDFTYVEGTLFVKRPESYKKNPNSYARPVDIANMNRQIKFNLYQGLANYVEAILNNDPSAMEPESFIEELVLKSAKPVKITTSSGVVKYKMEYYNIPKDKNKATKLWHKLNYFTGYKRMNRKQRGLIQPYMMYYAQKMLLNLAKKLIREGRF